MGRRLCVHNKVHKNTFYQLTGAFKFFLTKFTKCMMVFLTI